MRGSPTRRSLFQEAYRTLLDATLSEVESRCLVEAEWLNHHYAGTEHLLLGVCCLADHKAAKLVPGIGNPPVELCQLVVEVVGHGFEWNRWLVDHSELS